MAISTWEDFSDRLLRYQRLIPGYHLVTANEDGRQKRKDRFIQRRGIRFDGSIERLPDDATVLDLAHLARKLVAKGHIEVTDHVFLKGPDGPVEMQTPLADLRLSIEEVHSDRRLKQRVRELTPQALAALGDLEYLEESPHDTVPKAVIMALIERFDVNTVKRALKELGLTE
ncbi:hypothetical protein [Achromobacter sp. DH1f]|uniref:hypothetical protein n=1 Tax=Achromobacter sp. DH1f TaxID=1397275 RepID=UPI0004696A86|nr:hypothetical protein [Achromobacter sp. DH1f]